MNIPTNYLKQKALENIVFIAVMIIGLIYLAISGKFEAAKYLISLLILLPLCLGFVLTFLSILFDWRSLPVYGRQSLIFFIASLLFSIMLICLGWFTQLYATLALSFIVGMVMFILMKVFSIGQGNY